MDRLCQFLPVRAVAALFAGVLTGLSLGAAAEPLVNDIHLYNRTCGPIEVVILVDEECPQGLQTCRVTIGYGERSDILMTGALPAALTYLVEGRCEGDKPTLISGQCEATLIRLSPKHPGEDTSSLESAMEAPCRETDGSCLQIEGGDVRNKMVTQQSRTVDIELGLCDAQVDGLDHCQVQCKVR